MRSVVAVTSEVYDAVGAAHELLDQVKGLFPLSANSCGLLFVEPDLEADLLLSTIRENLPGVLLFGCTAMAQLNSFGYQKQAASLLLMTADDCFFSAAVAKDLEEDSLEKITSAFQAAAGGLGAEAPKLAFVFSILTDNCREQQKFDHLDALAGKQPLFGGVASDYVNFEASRVFLNESVVEKGMVVLLVGGNCKPKFVVRNLPRTRLAKFKVTRAEGLCIQTIDGLTVKDFLLEHGVVDIDSTLGLYYHPFNLELDLEDDYDGEPVCRPLVHVDQETGFARSVADIPEGSTVSLQFIQAADIIETSKEAVAAMADALRAAEGDGNYEYSTVIIATCAGRHVILALEHAVEAAISREHLGDKYTFSGFYSFGEFCPTSIRDGKAKNRLHNLSIALCAL